MSVLDSFHMQSTWAASKDTITNDIGRATEQKGSDRKFLEELGVNQWQEHLFFFFGAIMESGKISVLLNKIFFHFFVILYPWQ